MDTNYEALLEEADSIPSRGDWDSDPELIHKLAAALRSTLPRTVTTVEELDALPAGSVIRDSSSDVFEVVIGAHGSCGVEMTNTVGIFTFNWVAFPATVLFSPPSTEEGTK